MGNNFKKKEFYKDRQQSYIDFIEGRITFSAYSYEIDSWGKGELNQMDTRQLYETMKRYYEDE